MQAKPFKREFAFPGLVAFLSTQDEKGVLNVAPYSNLMAVLRPTDLVCVASWHKRDTLKNIRANGQFVISVPPAAMVDKVIPTAQAHPPEVSEFEVAGLTPRASKVVAPPGVDGCIAWLECELVKQYVEKSHVLILGRVVNLEFDDGCLDENGGFDPEKAQPLMMLQNNKGMRFVTLKDLGAFEPYGAMFFDGKDILAPHYED